MRTARVVGVGVFTLAFGSCGVDVDTASSSRTEALHASGLAINEFQAGSAGWIEVYNASSSAVNIGGWIVDDIANGGTAPKTITAGTTVASGAYLSISFAGFNTASADDVRLLDNANNVVDAHSNFWAGSSIAGLCFGRQPDGGAWASTSIACTKGLTNGGGEPCHIGASCDDGDVCTA